MLEFDVAWSHFDVAWGHFDVAWQKLWHKNDVFDEILGCAGHLTLPKKKWAPVAIHEKRSGSEDLGSSYVRV